MGRRPKTNGSLQSETSMRYSRGCNCKRSGCLKNYCECYEAKILCSVNCKCAGCRNREDVGEVDTDSVDPQMLADLQAKTDKEWKEPSLNMAKDSQKRVYGKRMDKMYGKNSEEVDASTSVGNEEQKNALTEKLSKNFITHDVIAATVQCMVRAADSCEQVDVPQCATERCVLRELGNCVEEIINTSILNKFTEV